MAKKKDGKGKKKDGKAEAGAEPEQEAAATDVAENPLAAEAGAAGAENSPLKGDKKKSKKKKGKGKKSNAKEGLVGPSPRPAPAAADPAKAASPEDHRVSAGHKAAPSAKHDKHHMHEHDHSDEEHEHEHAPEEHADDMHDIYPLGRYVLLHGCTVRVKSDIKSIEKFKLPEGTVVHVEGVKMIHADKRDIIRLHIEKGWISAATAKGSPNLQKAPEFDAGNYTVKRAVKLRQHVAADSEIECELHPKTKVKVKESQQLDNGTVRLHVSTYGEHQKGKKGWINAESKKGVPFLKKNDPIEMGKYVVVHRCKVRKHIDVNSELVKELEKGHVVNVKHSFQQATGTVRMEIKSGWISLKNQTGTVHVEPYVKPEPEPEPEPEPKKKKGKKGKGKVGDPIVVKVNMDKAEDEVRANAFKGKGAYVRKTRSCTDCLPCMLLIAYWVGMVVLAEYAFQRGNLNDLILPKDTDGFTCGTDNARFTTEEAVGPDLRNASRQYFPNPANEKMSVCVPFCPGSFPGRCLGNASRDYYAEAYNKASKAIKSKTSSLLSSAASKLNSALKNCSKCSSITNGLGINTSKLSSLNSSLQGSIQSKKVKKPGLKKDQSVLKSAFENMCNKRMPGPHGSCALESCNLAGDCLAMNKVGVSEAMCTTFGECKSSTKLTTNVGQNECNGTWTANTWTKYKWQPNEDKPFICKQRPLGPKGDDGKVHKDYPPKDMTVAMKNNWISGEGPCWMPVFQSNDVLFRCVPMMLVNFKDPEAFKESMAGQATAQHFHDLAEYWFVIPIVVFMSIVTSFVWVYFLSKFAGVLIWTTIYVVVTLLPCLGALFFYRAGLFDPDDIGPLPIGKYNNSEEFQAAKAQVEEAAKQVLEVMSQFEMSSGENYQAGMGCFIACGVLALVFTIFKTRVQISIGVIDESADAFLDMPLCVIFPLLTFCFSIPVAVYTFISTSIILSMRTIDPNTGLYVYTEDLKAMLSYNVFGGIWTIWWLSIIQYAAISGAIASWYFTFEENGKKSVGNIALLWSLVRTVRYHMGTMAFGSLIISIVMIVKFVLLYMISQIQAQSPENKLIQILGAVLKIFVGCVEKFVKFLGSLAFIETAIYGTAFCPSLFKAFLQLVKNAIRMSFVTLFSSFTLFLGKVLVVLFACWNAIFVVQFVPKSVVTSLLAGNIPDEYSSENLQNMTSGGMPEVDYDKPLPQAPVIAAALGASIVSWAIMGVYETAIDTILLCFLEDEKNNGDKGRVTFCSGDLLNFMSGTKSLSEATDAYSSSIRDAKTAKIRAARESEAQMSKAAAEHQHSKGKGPKDGKKKKSKGKKNAGKKEVVGVA